MLATFKLPDKYIEWNNKFGAPFGYSGENITSIKNNDEYIQKDGIFSLQENNTIRTFEYPWAFYATPIVPGLQILDIGGGLGGFQFALNKSGCHVTNIDPGREETAGWICNHKYINKLNSLFETDVKLKNTTIAQTDIHHNSIDRIFAISVIEHLSEDELQDVILCSYKFLRPGGYFIITVDLFLNIFPFKHKMKCKYGYNADLKKISETAPFKMVHGDRSELYGYPEFSPLSIITNMDNYLVGEYPAMAQCFVLQK